jgi:hypothetical protein
MRSAAKRKPEVFLAATPATAVTLRPAATRKPQPKPRMFHATVQVTRTEEWFVEAATAEEARELLGSGHGQRVQVGECTHFEIGKLVD